GLLRDGMGRSPAQAADLFGRWNEGRLKSYLVEISHKVLAATDEKTGKPMVDVILDRAGQKGTGRWTVIEALSLGQSASTIEAAVGARSWSAAREARIDGAGLFPGGNGAVELSDEVLEQALLAAKIIAYSQGFSLLAAASEHYDWNLDMGRIAEVWRAGCIIRSAMLDDMAAAARAGMPQGMLIFAPDFAKLVGPATEALRKVVAAAAGARIPVPAFSAALAYFDTMRQARGTTDLIQAQRDYFGAHGFERLDGGSGHHGPWSLG
ncbi:MAG: NADP-dependent phosphogluconate dehydrogenase, partial [Rhodobacteraceae bacterium]|nr:NADP-dependent phosphogluconate dehydrogenase [Paracoccaceae bacterium]